MSKVRKERKSKHERPIFHTFKFTKTKGQHILKNPGIVTSIVEKANIKPTDIVLEIGSGTGNLTIKLLEVAKQVIALEIDHRMVAELYKRVQDNIYLKNKLRIIQGDALKTEYPYFDICVGNIPFSISAPLTFKLLAHRPQFKRALIMYQREFAQRLVARPNDTLYCRLSVNSQLIAKVDHVLKIGSNNFRPPPKVDSSVVRFVPRYPIPNISFSEWDGLLRICFTRKHKTLGAIFKLRGITDILEQNYRTFCSLNNIMDHHHNLKSELLRILNEEPTYDDKRAATLDIDDFLKLLKRFNNANIYFSNIPIPDEEMNEINNDQ